MDSLQFQKAEYGDGERKCGACAARIEREYYQLSGHNICPACAERVRASQQHPDNAALVRGVLYGAGTAAACSAGYAAVIMITGLELALVAILVGYLVGRAIRKGARGLGGRRCQVAAVGFTYLAITFSYAPVAVRQIRQRARAERQKTAGSVKAVQTVTPGEFAVALATLTGLAMISPFLNLQQGVSGILGILIIGVGLWQAWKLTAGDGRPLTGPFQNEGAEPLG